MSDLNSQIQEGLDLVASPGGQALIQKATQAGAIVAGPFKTVLQSGANYIAGVIDANRDQKTMDIAQRAAHRRQIEDIRHQANIEAIVFEAAKQLSPDSDPSAIDDGWMLNFFDKSKNCSDVDAQKLWAKVLKGESESPGSISRRTVDILSNISPEEARLFETLCSFVWKSPVAPIAVVMTGDNPADGMFLNNGMSYTTCAELAAIGLVTFDGSGIEFQIHDSLTLKYFNKKVQIELPPNPHRSGLPIGVLVLTKPGQELYRICVPPEIPGVVEAIVPIWRAAGFIVSVDDGNPD